MENIVGKPVEGLNFFPRASIINKIYRRLGTDNIFMSAPRRVGKTSIMYHLRDNPREGFVFVFINTEAIKDTENFFKKVLIELLDSEAVKKYMKTFEKSKTVFEKIISKVKKLKVYEVEIELGGEDEKGSHFDEFKKLIQNLEDDGLKIVLMIDEFPTTIENISSNHGQAAAIHFLQLNRELRLLSSKAIRFIYTGSVGLPVLVRKLNEPETINDLNVVTVSPLSHQEAAQLTIHLLKKENIEYQENVIDYLVEKVEWLMPFFMQLVVQELMDVYDDTMQPLTKNSVEEAFKKLYNRRNNLHFESYNNRLKDAFTTEQEYTVAKKILSQLSINEELSYKKIFNTEKENNEQQHINKIILDTLEYDGYIFNRNENYRFNSPILRNWWKNNVL